MTLLFWPSIKKKKSLLVDFWNGDQFLHVFRGILSCRIWCLNCRQHAIESEELRWLKDSFLGKDSVIHWLKSLLAWSLWVQWVILQNNWLLSDVITVFFPPRAPSIPLQPVPLYLAPNMQMSIESVRWEGQFQCGKGVLCSFLTLSN